MRVSSTSHGILFLRRVAHGRALARLLALVLIATVGSVAWTDEVYRPEVPILKVAHEGDPVPGIPEATFGYLWPPQIDAQGNVLLRTWIYGPGIDESNDTAIWLGQPGALELVARDGQPAPDMAEDVVYSDVSPFAVVSETGWIAFTAYVTGPGIAAGVNDAVVFCGPPGDLQKVLQTGDPAPGLGPEVYVDPDQSLGATLSDNATLKVVCGTSGPGVSGPFTRAQWVGPRDNLELMVWEGMPVPGCPECDPDVVLQWVDLTSFNDAGQMAFRGGLSGPGIFWANDNARWLGSPGDWEMLHREWQTMPEFGEGVTLRSAAGVDYVLNKHGDKVDRIRLQGPGITDENDWVLVAGEPEPMGVLVREGDTVPEAGEDVQVDTIGGGYVNNQHQILYRLRYAGPSIDESNMYGIYFGPYVNPQLVMREGNPVAYSPSGTVFHNLAIVTSLSAMNDVGDFVATTDVESAAREVSRILGLWRDLTGQYVPILEPGDELYGRTVTTDLLGYLGDYWTLTGGADGRPQSFNDLRQLAVQLDFTDGTHGVYRVGPPLLGDTDGDGEVTAAELAAFADCITGPGGEYAEECAPLDLDLDGDVDLRDFAPLQAMVGEAR